MSLKKSTEMKIIQRDVDFLLSWNDYDRDLDEKFSVAMNRAKHINTFSWEVQYLLYSTLQEFLETANLTPIQVKRLEVAIKNSLV